MSESHLGDAGSHDVEFSAMESVAGRRRSEVLAKEKLSERCAIVNGLAEKLGV